MRKNLNNMKFARLLGCPDCHRALNKYFMTSDPMDRPDFYLCITCHGRKIHPIPMTELYSSEKL